MLVRFSGRTGAGRTWSRSEKGKHVLNVAFESMPVMKDWQSDVILLLNPLSKGEGRGLALSVVSAAMLLVVVEDATVDEDDIEVTSVVLAATAARGLRSSVSGSGTGSAAHWRARTGGGL
jgi:hypothetical protein